MVGGPVDRDEITAPMSRVFVYPNETGREETEGDASQRPALSAEFSRWNFVRGVVARIHG